MEHRISIRAIQRPKLLFGALLASLALLCIGASSASALPDRFFGMAGDPQYGSPSNWEALQKAGVQKYRLQINWFHVASAGPWNQPSTWENTYDRDFIQAAAHGIAILPYLFGREQNSSQYYLKGGEHYNEWLSFVEYVVRRYGQAGTFWMAHPELPQYPVTAWEVWNEPNLSGNCPSGACNGKQYGEFLVGTSAAIKGVQFQKGYETTVLFGGLYQEAWNYPVKNYIEAAAKAPEIKKAYDGLALHPYALGQEGEPQRTFPDKAAGVPSNVSAAYNAQANAPLPSGGVLGVHPIWITEVGWPVDEGRNGNGPVQTVDEGEQAGLLDATYNWVKVNYNTYSIKYVAWYDYGERDELDWSYHSGLRTIDDDFRQAWYAYEGQTGAAKWPAGYSYKQGTSTGSGNFSWAATNLLNYFQPIRTAVGDINGDGKADIVSVEKEPSTGKYVYVRGLSNGSGNFSWAGTNLTEMSEPLKMDLGDVNGDGKADIVAVERESGGGFRYMLGTSTGSGNFSWNFTNLNNYFRPVAMALGDISGDGKADIVSVEREGSGSSYTYVRGISNGTGGFQWEGTGLKGFYHPFKMDLGDINGDGKADIVAVEKNVSQPQYYSYVRGISNGSGGFAWEGVPSLGAMRQPVKMALGDIDGDKKADIVAVERDPETDGVYTYVRGISKGTGDFAWAGTNLTKMWHPQKMVVGDVTGDGKADIISVEH